MVIGQNRRRVFTWDSESYEGNRLQYFGMTDAERIAFGVTISYWTIDRRIRYDRLR